MRGLDDLTKLKGIGPATASLLLSVATPEAVPFFSDELFKWSMWDETGSPAGWKRQIKYNKKEYEALLGKVRELRGRLGVRAMDAEKVAWVLGKEKLDCGDEEEEEGVGSSEDAGKETEKTEVEVEVESAAKQTSKKGMKRKAADSKASTVGTRKSARTKK